MLVVAPLAGQQPGAPLVFPGARVLATAPVMGKGWKPGQFATARVRGRTCLGVALDAPDKSGAPLFVLLRGVTSLRVDRRTNSDVRIAVDLPPAADSDWATIDLAALARQDSSCTTPAAPARP
jgi:hypothetical protein